MSPNPPAHAVKFSGPPKFHEQQDGIDWTPAKRNRFRAAIQTAGTDTTFIFDGHEFVTGYAEYLLDYLDMVLT